MPRPAPKVPDGPVHSESVVDLEKDMVFESMERLRTSTHLYSMRESFPLKVRRSDLKRFEVICANSKTYGCTFRLKAKGFYNGPAWITHLWGKHFCHGIDQALAKPACGRGRVLLDALRKFLADHPKTTLPALQDALSKECGVNVPEDDIKRGIRMLRRDKTGEPLNFRVGPSTNATSMEQAPPFEADDSCAC